MIARVAPRRSDCRLIPLFRSCPRDNRFNPSCGRYRQLSIVAIRPVEVNLNRIDPTPLACIEPALPQFRVISQASILLNRVLLAQICLVAPESRYQIVDSFIATAIVSESR